MVRPSTSATCVAFNFFAAMRASTEFSFILIFTPPLFAGNAAPGFYNFFGMGFIFWLQKYFANNAFFIQHKGGSVHAHVFMAKHLLFAPNAVLMQYFMRGIGDKRKGKAEFFFELFVLFTVIGANANYGKAMLCKQCKVVSKIAGLYGAGGRIIFGIKVDDYLASFKIAECNAFAILIGAFKCRGFIAFF